MNLDLDRRPQLLRWLGLLFVPVAAVTALVGCSSSSEEPASPTVTTTSATVAPVTTEPVAPATTARPSTGGSGGGSGGIVEGDIPLRLPGPDLAVCAIWEEDLRNPPADAPESFHDTTLQRLHEGECPGY
ncbi:MAG TPA: hypothetical protein VF711_10185 [Acidimicrobiales bacterium]|jgi:hypothetical protein